MLQINYEALPSSMQKRINEVIDSLEIDPLSGVQIKKLSGKLKGLYRYRLGKLRIIYQVLETDRKVLVAEIGPRGDVYK